ncbi:MAG: hypothetical protein IPP97_07190 [Candidatus Obscuribacter sp.]|nr:hypothetical protein [Candidatus Obscuribacter sp.]MBP6591481.1 hypothetical protein [Candidatus Obscuribacter sp.]
MMAKAKLPPAINQEAVPLTSTRQLAVKQAAATTITPETTIKTTVADRIGSAEKSEAKPNHIKYVAKAKANEAADQSLLVKNLCIRGNRWREGISLLLIQFSAN